MVAVWDDVAGVSLIQNLGFRYNQFTEGLVTPEGGGTIDFGTLQGWSIFDGSQDTDINYMVFAGLNTGNGSGAGQRQLLFTRTGTVTGALGNRTSTAPWRHHDVLQHQHRGSRRLRRHARREPLSRERVS